MAALLVVSMGVPYRRDPPLPHGCHCGCLEELSGLLLFLGHGLTLDGPLATHCGFERRAGPECRPFTRRELDLVPGARIEPLAGRRLAHPKGPETRQRDVVPGLQGRGDGV